MQERRKEEEARKQAEAEAAAAQEAAQEAEESDDIGWDELDVDQIKIPGQESEHSEEAEEQPQAESDPAEESVLTEETKVFFLLPRALYNLLRHIMPCAMDLNTHLSFLAACNTTFHPGWEFTASAL